MWDGTLTICCFDGMMNLNLGNVNEQPFEELWYGDKANEIRLKHIRGEFDQVLTRHGYPKCLHCKGYDTPQLSDDEIKEFCSAVGKPGEYRAYLKRAGKTIKASKR
jgi:hypothetical protein